MDRQSVIRVLADPSRYAVYEHLTEAGEPCSVGQLSDSLGLHPSTVRLHLEKLREAGLVESAPDRHGAVGRPHHLWSVAVTAPGLGLEPAGFRLLSHLLADLAARVPSSPAGAAEVGRRRGVEGFTNRPAPRPGRRLTARCLEAAMGELAGLGFDPSLETGSADGQAVIAFARCPFRELAALYPDLVCELHRGLTEGILAGVSAADPAGGLRLDGFSTLVDRDPCRAEVTIPA